LDIAKLVKDRTLKNSGRENKAQELHTNDNRKWATFSYVGKEVIPITKVLK
jgi:hypothetical protein